MMGQSEQIRSQQTQEQEERVAIALRKQKAENRH
jgi:hypothetical protein